MNWDLAYQKAKDYREPEKSKRNKKIKELYAEGIYKADLARRFQLTKQRIDQIIRNFTGIDGWTRNRIKKRDKFKCVICDSKKFLEVHHIDGNKKNNEEYNLATLCRECHIRVEKQDFKTFKKRDKYPAGVIRGKRGRVTKVCCKCGKAFEKILSKANQKFCTRECQKLTPEEKKLKHRVASRNWRKNRYANDRTWREKQKKYIREYMQKRKISLRGF